MRCKCGFRMFELTEVRVDKFYHVTSIWCPFRRWYNFWKHSNPDWYLT